MKLLICDQQPDWRLEFISRHLTTDWTISTRGDDRDAYAADMLTADAAVAMRFGSRSPPAPALRLLQLPGAGFELVDFDVVPASCTVCNVFEHEIPIAEYLLLGMLEWQIHMARMSAGLRRGVWNDGTAVGNPVHGELYGKTVGFIGFGHIGRETASRLQPFGVRCLACTRSPHKYGTAQTSGLAQIRGMDGLDAMLAESDFIIVACPLTDATRGLIDAQRLGRMKSSAVVLNVARAAVIDQAALFAACRSRRIAGAVLDVWSHYPDRNTPVGEPTFPSDYPFQDLPNVVMTPHASGWTDSLWDRRWNAICANLDRLARDEPLHNVLRKPGGQPPG